MLAVGLVGGSVRLSLSNHGVFLSKLPKFNETSFKDKNIFISGELSFIGDMIYINEFKYPIK